MKKKVILSSVISIVLCLSLICGATFALFTDTETVNVAVTSGQVDVNATVDKTLLVKSRETEWTPGTDFTTGGFVQIAGNTLEMNRIVPGDAVLFAINVTNNSNVDIKYRTKIAVVEGRELFSALNVYISNDQEEVKTAAATEDKTLLRAGLLYTGSTRISEWSDVRAKAVNEEAPTIQTVYVLVEFPYLSTDQSDLMDQNTKFAFTVEAVQGNADVRNRYLVTADNYTEVNFAQAKTDFVFSGDFPEERFPKGIVIEKLDAESTLCFEDVSAKAIVLPDGAKIVDANTITGTGITGTGDLTFTDGALTITDGGDILLTADDAVATFTNMEVVSNAGIKIENVNKISGDLILTNSTLDFGGSISVSAANGRSTLEIVDSHLECYSIFVGGHSMNYPKSTAVFNVKNSYVGCEENDLGSTIAIWGQTSVQSTITDSEIHTYSRGWHQSEDANDNAITFQSGDVIDVDIERTNMHLYGGRCVVYARAYGSNAKTENMSLSVKDSVIWTVSKSQKKPHETGIWSDGELKLENTVAIITKYAYSEEVETSVDSTVYGSPTIYGNYSITTQCNWAHDIAIGDGQTLTLAEGAAVSVYEGAAAVNFALSGSAKLVLEKGATLTNIGVIAADGYTLNTVTENGVTTYSVEKNETSAEIITTTNSKKITSDTDLTEFKGAEDTTYHLIGDFNDSVVNLTISQGLDKVVIDGSEATGISELLVSAPGAPDNYGSVSKITKAGSVVIANFKDATQISLLAYGTDVQISNNKTEYIYVYGANLGLEISYNQIDGNFKNHNVPNTTQTNDYGVYLGICDYTLKFDNNIITDSYSHAVGINGIQTTFPDCSENNKIESFTGNSITVNTTYKTERAALKIWDDKFYAPSGNGNNMNENAQALVESFKSKNTFNLGDGHYCFQFDTYSVSK